MLKNQSKANWPEIIDHWKSTGKTRSAFCREQQLNYHRFNYHYKKWYDAQVESQRGKRFVPLSLSPANLAHSTSPNIVFELPGKIKMRVPLTKTALTLVLQCIGGVAC